MKTAQLVLHPRFGKSWVHYDRSLVDAKTSEKISSYRSGFGCNSFERPEFPSWRWDFAVDYITAPDKKEWRAIHDDWDKEISISKFERDVPLFNYQGKITEVVRIVDVVVDSPPYVCPQSGCVWFPRKNQPQLFSKRLWIMKLMPKEPVFMLGPDGIELILKKHKTKSAFLSGALLKTIDRWSDDPRKFLWEKEGVNKIDVIRSAARQFKKLQKRITPLPKQTIMFFKTWGVLRHIQNAVKR